MSKLDDHKGVGMRLFLSGVLVFFLAIVCLSCSTGPSPMQMSGGSVSVEIETGAADVEDNQTVRVTFSFSASVSSVNDSTFFIVPTTRSGSALSRALSDLDATICNPANAIPATVVATSSESCNTTFTLITNSVLAADSEYTVCLTGEIQACDPDIDGVFLGAMGNFTTAEATECAANTSCNDLCSGTGYSDDEGTTCYSDSACSSECTEAVDTTAPTVAVTSGATTLTATSPFSVTVTFSEDVTGFDASDISVTNGAASNLVATTPNRVFTADITPSGDPVNLSISVSEDKATDAAGNGNEVSNTFAIRYDTSNLTAAITSAVADSTNDSPFSVTITFSEAVTGFDVTDLVVTNGTASNFNSSANPVFTADITPTADGEVRVAVGAGIASDVLTGIKANLAASTYSVDYDGTVPTVAITSAESILTGSSPFSITITFSEVVSGFAVGDIAVTNGSASNLVATTPNRVFTADITPSGDPVNLSISVPADKATDAASNNNEVSNTFAIRYDTSNLTVATTSAVSDPTNDSPFSVTITFSEAVTGFALEDISVTNGSVSNLNSAGNPVFTADITPTTDGDVTVDIDADEATDTLTGMKSNTAATSYSTTFDDTEPTIDSTTPANGASSISIASTIAVTFDEAMATGTLTTNTANTTCSGTLQVSTSANNFSSCVRMSSAPVASNGNKTFTITPSSNLSVTTTYKVRVTTSATDAAGNALASTYTMGSGFTTGDMGGLWVFDYAGDTVYKITLTPTVGTWSRASKFTWSGHSNLQVDSSYYAYLKGYSSSQVRKYNTAGGALLASSASSYSISNSETALADGYFFMFEDPSNLIIHVLNTTDMSVVDASADANNYFTTSTPYGIGLGVIGDNIFIGGPGPDFLNVYDWNAGTHTISNDPNGRAVTIVGGHGAGGWITDIVSLSSGKILIVNKNDRYVEVGTFDDATNTLTITDSFQPPSSDYPWRAAQGADGSVYVLSETYHYIYVFNNYNVDGFGASADQTYTGSSGLTMTAMVYR